MKTLSVESGETSHGTHPENSMINGVTILEFLLRFLAAGGTLASAMAMGTAEETVPLLSQSVLLNAKFSDLPMFTFFVIANSVACAYLVLSLPLSFYHIIKRADKNTRLILVTFDTAMLALVTAGASAAASIVYLAHEGNANANWSAVCQQLDSFCERTSGSLIASFASAFVLILVIISSAIAISHC
ncbi:CASP-like protein 1A1 [Hibiscus trionum]|uniref:CASP-like protein n=1 Tax=Hibiscus trionum TaxID=183268 RepID=A0A9W7MFI4_HIBTR|nr:CASP-like protein 1A1 [Hibiscus trionum]